MKHAYIFITAIIASFFFFSCIDTKKEDTLSKITTMQDSIDVLVERFHETQSQAHLDKAMLLSDEIVKIAPSSMKMERFNDARTNLFILKKDRKSAFLLKGELIPNDWDNIDRLVYNGIKNKMEQKADSSDFYFDLALDKLNTQSQQEPLNAVPIITRITIHISRGDKQKAEEEIKKALISIPEQKEVFESLQNNLDNMIEESQSFIGKN